jgi:hypothetical protein
VAGLLEARCEPALLSTVLELLGSGSPRTTLLHTTGGEMIKSLSLLFRDHDSRTPTDEKNPNENVSVMSRIVAQVLFPVANNAEAASTAYEPFFAHLAAAGGKFSPATMSSQANILVDFLERGGDMGIVLAAARMAQQPAWLSAKLFALGLHLLGMHEQASMTIKPSAALAVRLTTAMKRAGVIADDDDLGRLYRHALPLDLPVVLDSSSAELTAGRLLQAATKAAVSKCGLDGLCSVVASLHRHHPHSLEPLVSLILTRYNTNYPQYVVDPELFIPVLLSDFRFGFGSRPYLALISIKNLYLPFFFTSEAAERQHPDPGSGMNNPDHIFYSLETIFLVLLGLKYRT